MRPAALNAFVATPRLPRGWERMALRKVHGFGGVFDLEVTREGGKLRLNVVRDGRSVQSVSFEEGGSVRVEI